MTPDVLKACYDFLNETLPFRNWNLPDSDDVEFRVVNDRSIYGYHRIENGKHIIGLSCANIGHTDTMIQTLAHEMVHVRERSIHAAQIGHLRAFRAWAAQVCKHHGFDPKSF